MSTRLELAQVEAEVGMLTAGAAKRLSDTLFCWEQALASVTVRWMVWLLLRVRERVGDMAPVLQR